MPSASDTTHQQTMIQNQLNQQGYEVLSLLGKGGSGSVWLAQDSRLNRKVAIKLLHTDSATQSQMVEEARLLAKFNHPGVVQIYDILTIATPPLSIEEQTEQQSAIVMEYIQGNSLLNWHQEALPDNDSKLAVLLQLAQSLAYIHQQDIVHGDIKPANILMRGTQPVITDFGEAFAKIHAEQTAVRSTQSWSAPEVQTQGSISPASDAYSFGLLALWLLSHWHPSQAQPNFNLDEQQHQQFLAQFDSVSQSLPQGLNLLLRKLLNWQPESRLSDFSLIALELQQLVRLTQQQMPLNQDTVLIEDVPSPESTTATPKPGKKKSLWLAGFALLALIAISGGLYLLNTAPQTRFIALLPPEVTGSLDANREQLLASAVSHAIENNIINNKDFLLIPSTDIRGVIRQAKEQEDGPLNLTQIVGNAMGATDVISIALDCAITHCDVSLARSEKPADADTHTDENTSAKWTTSLSDRFSTPLVDNLRFSDAISQRFPRLFQLEGDGYSEAANISEEAYSRYLEILTEFRENEGGGDLDGLLAELEELIEAYPDFYSWYWLYRRIGLKAYYYSQKTEYVSSVSEILVSSPNKYKNTKHYLVDLFLINLEKNELDKANKNLMAMSDLGIPDTLLNYYRALLSLDSGNYTTSAKLLESVKRYNSSSDVLHNLALSYWYTGRVDSAIKTLQQAITFNPYLIELKQTLGSTLLVAGQLDKAAEIYSQIIEKTQSSRDLSHLSVVQTLQKNYPQALISAERAVSLNPDEPSWRLNLADILKLMGKIEQAQMQYTKALELVHSENGLNERLISVQAASQLGRVDEAIFQIESIKKDYPNDGYVLFTAALVYALLKRPNLAVFHINESLKMNFDAIWFSLPWFNDLCGEDSIREKISSMYQESVCPDS